MKTKPILTSAVVLALLAPAFAVHAASTWTPATWAMDSGCISGTCSTTYSSTAGQGTQAGNTATFSSSLGNPTMTASAFSTALTDTSCATTFAKAKLMEYDSWGWGVIGGAETNLEGPHAMDNVYGVDLIQLAFGSAEVALNKVTVGWNGDDSTVAAPYTDSDISVLAYVGDKAAIGTSIEGKTTAELLATTSWKLVAATLDAGNPANNTVTFNVLNSSTNPNPVKSSWWIVSAYNAFTSSSTYCNPTCGSGINDAVKLLAVAGDVLKPPSGETPEPAGIALVGLGLLGLMASRRRVAK
jgi:hypothetical protein